MSVIEFLEPIKNSRAYKMICNDIQYGLGHAYMIVSPDETLIENFFKLVGATIFCENKTGCLECVECNRVLHGNHPDVFFINTDKKALKVGETKPIISEMAIKSLSSKKVYFFERVDLLNAQSQNAFLKTLEEPPQNMTIFLGVCNEASILNTISSRSRTIYLDLFDEEVIYKELIKDGINEETAKIAASCSEGQLGKAKLIAESESYTQLYKNAIYLLTNLNKSPDVMTLDMSIAGQQEMGSFLDVLSIILSDMLHEKSKGNVKSIHVLKDIETLATKYSERAIAEIIYRINEERKKIELHVSTLSTIEDLLFFMLEVKHKWQ